MPRKPKTFKNVPAFTKAIALQLPERKHGSILYSLERLGWVERKMEGLTMVYQES